MKALNEKIEDSFLDAIVEFAKRLRNALFPVATLPDRTILIVEPRAFKEDIPSSDGGFFIGKSSDGRENVIASSQALDRHLLIIGGTGCGKTTLIARLFTEEILKWQ